MKGKKIIGLVIGLGIIVTAGGYVYRKNHTKVIETMNINVDDKLDYDYSLKKEEIIQDREQMIKIMEETHPIFLEDVPDEYEKAKKNYVENTNKDMTVKAFKFETARYLSSIEDGHTGVYWDEERYLDVNWKYSDGTLKLLDEGKRFTGKEINKINGILITDIINFIDKTFPAENYVAEYKNYEQYLRCEFILEEFNIDCSKSVTLQTSEGENITVEFKNAVNNEKKYEIYSRQEDQDTIYVKLGVCDFNEDLDKVIESLHEALKNNIKTVVIDVSDNPGGDSNVCDKVLSSLNIRHGEFGVIERFSPLANNLNGVSKTDEFRIKERNNYAEGNSNINLYVITNENTFSSAQWMATWVKDGKLGTIVGRPSSNMPSSFGDTLHFQLNNSRLLGSISFKKWTRPDESRDKERILEPDIMVSESENALDVIKSIK